MESYYIKMSFRGLVNYVKVQKHEESWEYTDFLLTASMYANISVYKIDYLTDQQGIKIPEENFLDIVNQYKNHPEFQLKIVLKHDHDESSDNQGTPVSRQNCRSGHQMYINAEDLESYISKTASPYVLCKKFKQQETLKGLSDIERRAITRESVDYLISRFSYNPEPNHTAALTLTVVELFPQLRTNEQKNGGIDALYNRKTNRGFIIDRLNRVRQKLYAIEKETGQHSTRKRSSSGSSVIPSPPDPLFDLENDENFLILRNLNVQTQKHLIKQKLRETLPMRMNNIFQGSLEVKAISKNFPFLFTSSDLIQYDFEIRYPSSHDLFLNKWKTASKYIENIYVVTKGPNLKRIPEIEELLPSMRDFFYLVNILPQVVAGKLSANTRREPFVKILNKILVFRTLNLPPEELRDNELKHLYIIAEGENKSAISQYYLCIENELIILPNNYNFIETVDLLFKAHYIFWQNFDSSLKTFWTFISHYFYKIETTGSITSRIKEIASKLDLQQAQNI